MEEDIRRGTPICHVFFKNINCKNSETNKTVELEDDCKTRVMI